MKKIMLVDDEILTRDSIRNSIDWQSHGYIYCGDASDGEMALPLIEEWRPQILITDIKMPFMDGIELATVVRKNYPEMKIIILSGHDEFRFAQKAIQIGVQDYCLKPVGAKDLLDLLNKVSKQIDQEQQKQHIISYTPEKLFSDICGGLISTSKAIEIAQLFNISLLNRYYVVLSLEVLQTELEEGQNGQLYKTIENNLSSYMNENIEMLSYRPSRKEMVCIVKSHDDLHLHSFIDRIKDASSDNLSLTCDILIGIGKIKARLQAVHESYLEAMDDRNTQRHLVQTQTIASNFLSSSTIQKPYINRDSFIEFIKIGTHDELNSFIQNFSSDLEKLNWHSSMYGLYILNELTLEAFHTAKTHFSLHTDSTDQLYTFQEMIKNIQTIEQAKHYLITLINKLWVWRKAGANQYSELINKVKLYVNNHYQNNQLSLLDVSKHIGISPSHLSKVFSQETNQTLTEFITQSRINKAMELLKTTNYKTFEIAYKVGYQDQHYFSNTFKKLTGVSPMAFRKSGEISDSSSLQLHKETL